MVAAGNTPLSPEELEQLAAIAALEGYGVLTEQQRRLVDEDRVRALEQAAGALFAALAPRFELVAPEGADRRLHSVVSTHAAAAAEGARGRTAHWHDTLRDVRQREDSRPDAPEWEAEPSVHRDAGSGDAVPPSGPGLALVSGWLAAAALLVATLFAYGRMSDLGGGAPESRRAELIATASDVQVLPWSTDGVSGDVTWSDASNEGYMRIQGLDVNDPSVSQYQLWIFRGDDPAAEAHPVSGGVFDVATEGEVVIPIDAQLEVGRAGIFAVSVEQPGGVMVSGREQIVLVASRT